jgi:FkbM family methyltransferase
MLEYVNRWTVFRTPTRVWGFDLTPPTLDRKLALLAHRWGLLGQEERRFLEHRLLPDSVLIDVGANQGLFVLLASRLSPQGSIFAIEPDPDMHLCLEQNIVANGLTNIRAIRCAASDRPGTLRFAPGRFNRGDNRVQMNTRNMNSSSLEVPAARLDDLIPQNTRIDLIKIDVQGWEVPVLRGAKKTLSENYAIILLIEFWPFGLRAAGFEPAELLEQLKNQGFHIRNLGKKGRTEALEKTVLSWKHPYRYSNLVACRDLDRIDS